MPAAAAVRLLSGPTYLWSLRVLGAWWCRGSSGVAPYHLLLAQECLMLDPAWADANLLSASGA
jgi:hypothetical protein